MKKMSTKYVNPFTDFGFKKLFGEEASKPLLVDFLNSLLPQENQIVELNFKNSELSGLVEEERKVVYDIYCENEKGEKFIVELQKAKQNYFKDRTIYYSTFPIREQADKGKWNFNLKAVYCIGILDFTFDDYESALEKNEVLHIVKLKNQHNKVFYDKLCYIYLEIPNFKKNESELITRLDKWLYFIKNLEDFREIPNIIMNDKIFYVAFEKAELAKFEKKELVRYEQSLKVYRDIHNVIDTSYQEGLSEGRLEGKLEGKLEIAKKMKNMRIPLEQIIQLTLLSVKVIMDL